MAPSTCFALTRQKEDRPIIIVSHSLGGLVAAQLFVHGEQGNEGSSAKNIVRNIRGLIFLGTPFRGSVLGGPAESARKILKWIGVETQEQTLKLLGVDSEPLKELTRAFANMLNKRRTSKDTNDKIDAFFFYETLPTKIGLRYVQIVQPESAQLPGCGDNVPIRANHRDICKFTSNEDEGYGIVVAAITKILAPPDADASVVRTFTRLCPALANENLLKSGRRWQHLDQQLRQGRQRWKDQHWIPADSAELKTPYLPGHASVSEPRGHPPQFL